MGSVLTTGQASVRSQLDNDSVDSSFLTPWKCQQSVFNLSRELSILVKVFLMRRAVSLADGFWYQHSFISFAREVNVWGEERNITQTHSLVGLETRQMLCQLLWRTCKSWEAGHATGIFFKEVLKALATNEEAFMSFFWTPRTTSILHQQMPWAKSEPLHFMAAKSKITNPVTRVKS